MSEYRERIVKPEDLNKAAENYVDCLALPAPEKSRILIIADDLSGENLTYDHIVRSRLAAKITKQLQDNGQNVGYVFFNEKMTKEELHEQTGRALHELEAFPKDSDCTTTVVYLAAKYLERAGIYDAASEYGKDHYVRFAGSLGFRAGDCRVMAQMNEEQRSKIRQANEYYAEFFKKHPKGKLKINTTDANGAQYELRLNYNSKHAPFETDMGSMGSHPIKIPNKNFDYVNIPGGETFTAPFVLRKVSGKFAAQGLIFTIEKGMLVCISPIEGTNNVHYDPAQQKLMEIIMNGGKIPIAELGLGFFGLAGIKTYEDCAVLSSEKAGPHIGLGHNVSTTPEAKSIAALARDFTHTDFVLDNPIIELLVSQNRTILLRNTIQSIHR